MKRAIRSKRSQAAHCPAGISRLAGLLVLVALAGFQPGRSFAQTPASAVSDGQSIELSRTSINGVVPGGDVLSAPQHEGASGDVHYVADWVASTRDNQELPYILVDKVNAMVFVFDAEGGLQAKSAALLGMVPGDGSADGVGSRALSAIAPNDRTTPAGRFMASVGPDLKGKDILWIDYDSALALHRVAKGTPAERRAQRLESPTPGDNRISYGCINVPVSFYETFIGPAFSQTGGVVYILPEMSSARELFKQDVTGTTTEAVHGTR